MVSIDFKAQEKWYAHSDRQAKKLTSSIDEWIQSEPVFLTAKKDEDRLGWSLFVNGRSSPPLDDWGIEFGQVVNSLRSILDSTLATITENTKQAADKQTKIQFPIADTRKEWSRQKKWVEHLPEKYIERIEKAQPYNWAKEGEVHKNLLLILNKLSNRSKHVMYPDLSVAINELSHYWSMEFETVEDAAKSIPPDVEITIPDYIKGGVMLRQRTKGRIAHVNGKHQVSLVMKIEAIGEHYEVTELLSNLGVNVGIVFDALTAP